MLAIAQGMLWFMLFPLLGGNLLNQKAILGASYFLSPRQRQVNVLLPLTFILIFCVIFYFVYADNYIITDHYFLSCFSWRMLFFGIPGYLAASFSFTNYLTLADQFDSLNLTFQNTPGASLTAPPFSEQIKSLKNAFNNAFTCSAAILSIFVFWEGLLITAINNMGAYQFFHHATGNFMIASDLVYLTGLMHTCILLAFYIPVRLKLSSLAISQPGAVPPAATNSFSSIFSGIQTVLMTGSPIIASSIQLLLNHVFN